ncbi:MAG: PmoA family protein [Planctomycetes bacterium]|nr:PmoA family protein [Planctomycetota bacterium]
MIHALLALGLLLQEKTEFMVDATSEAVVGTIAGKEVLRYQLKKPADSKLSVDSACYFHPLKTPAGVVLTDVAPADHKHHRGIFLAWFDMHGKKDADFWGWGMYAPVKDRVIVNRKAEGNKVENDWMAEGETLLKEGLTFNHRVQGVASVLDLVYELSADADVKILKGAFSGFCLRARKDGKATVEGPEGEVQRPAPNHMKPETDWPAQPWYGYQITLPDGVQIGGAVLDHPKNPPALWHNPASIRMLNPCITAPGDVVIRKGEPLVFRYRVLAWDGALPRELINSLAKEWAK